MNITSFALPGDLVEQFAKTAQHSLLLALAALAVLLAFLWLMAGIRPAHPEKKC